MCVYVDVFVCIYVCACVMQDVSENKNLISLERVAAGHQKATESEIRTQIGSILKISPFQEGDLKKKNPAGANVVETEPFVM